MDLSRILSPDAVFHNIGATDKKTLLFEISKKVESVSGKSSHEIYEKLIEREKLASTALGDGVAIPHIRCDQVEEAQGFFFKLRNPIEFGAVDGNPVDLVFFLMTPMQDGADHLQAMAAVARNFKNKDVCQKIRNAVKPEAVYMMLTAEERESLAA